MFNTFLSHKTFLTMDSIYLSRLFIVNIKENMLNTITCALDMLNNSNACGLSLLYDIKCYNISNLLRKCNACFQSHLTNNICLLCLCVKKNCYKRKYVK